LVDKLEKLPSQGTAVPVDSIFNQIAALIKAGQASQANALLDEVMHNPQANGPILTQVAQFYAQTGNLAKSEEAMLRATVLEPNSSQTWYNLANVQAFQGHAADAAESLKKAFAANAVERAAQPAMIDLRQNALTNPNFSSIRANPAFRAVLGTN
jgi:predicted Zn-dependent protease